MLKNKSTRRKLTTSPRKQKCRKKEATTRYYVRRTFHNGCKCTNFSKLPLKMFPNIIANQLNRIISNIRQMQTNRSVDGIIFAILYFWSRRMEHISDKPGFQVLFRKNKTGPFIHADTTSKGDLDKLKNVNWPTRYAELVGFQFIVWSECHQCLLTFNKFNGNTQIINNIFISCKYA